MKFRIIICILVFSANIIYAQLKIGNNSTQINSSNNLEVEAISGQKVFINKSDGRTFIENTPSAGATDSILFKAANGEVRQMSLARFRQLINQNQTVTFGYSSAGWQSFMVPSGITQISFDVYGSKGAGSNGGNGARVKGVINVTPGQVLYILVGKIGQYNGGRGGVNSANSNNNGFAGGDASIISSNSTSSQSAIYVIAGGGGGASGGNTYVGGTGGQNGSNGGYNYFQSRYIECGNGATQSSGGARGTSWDCVNFSTSYYGSSGSAINGGTGGNATVVTHFGGGGGGGGYFGGGGAAGGGTSVGAGGGGSSYVNSAFCTNVAFQSGVNNSDGIIYLSY